MYDAVSRSNGSVGGRVIHKGNAEYLVRSIGWIRDVKDIEGTVLKEVGGQKPQGEPPRTAAACGVA